MKIFLEQHLGNGVAITSGEIIDNKIKETDTRPQLDVIIFDSNFPKIHHGSDQISAVMVESVRAIIEVKSTLTEKELKSAIKQAFWVKNLVNVSYLERRVNGMPIRSYVVAYACNAKIETVVGWLNKIHETLNIDLYPFGDPGREINRGMSPSVDSVYVLGQGFISYFDPFVNNTVLTIKAGAKWVMCEQTSNNLLPLFVDLAWICNGTHLREYLSNSSPARSI